MSERRAATAHNPLAPAPSVAAQAPTSTFWRSYANHLTIAGITLFLGLCMLIHRVRHGGHRPAEVPLQQLLDSLRANQPFLAMGIAPNPDTLPALREGHDLWPIVQCTRACMELQLGRGTWDEAERTEHLGLAEAALSRLLDKVGDGHAVSPAARLAYALLCEETGNTVQMNLQYTALLTTHADSAHARYAWGRLGMTPVAPDESGFGDAKTEFLRSIASHIRTYAEAERAIAEARAQEAPPPEEPPPGEAPGESPPEEPGSAPPGE